MNIVSEVRYLVWKELMIEWRQKFSFYGLLLYILSTVFVCYLSFTQLIDVRTWAALLWIILLFTSVNAVAKSFIHETGSLYYYTIVSPQAVILSKIIYNALLTFILSVISFFAYAIFIGNMAENIYLFIFSLLLGNLGFSIVLTLISAIAAKAGQSATLLAILGFPVILPLLITAVRLSTNAAMGIDFEVSTTYVFVLIAINVIGVALSYLLFPYLWTD